MFPAIAPDVPLLRRGPHEVQLGVDPADALVLSGLSTTEIAWLTELDGSRSIGTFVGPAGERFRTLVGDLVARGAVIDAHHPPSLVPRTVVVGGDGATSRALAALLRESGVTVRCGRAAVDETDLALRTGREPLTGDSVDLVVGVAYGAVSPVDAWSGHDVAYLPVLVRPRSAEVGPLVDGNGPCLHCLDLTRADHDPAWATVLAQMSRMHEPSLASPVPAAAAALAYDRILGLFSGDDVSRSGPLTAVEESVEMSFAPVRLRRRSWSRHPRCRRH